MDKITVAAAREAEAIGKQVRLQGWVRTRRDSKGGFSFLELNDGSCLGNVQVVADGGPAPTTRARSRSSPPAAASPSRARSRRRRPRARPTEVAGRRRSPSTAGPIPRRYPLQKKGHTFEFLRTIAHLRPRTNTFGAIARVRNRVSQVDPRLLPGAGLPLRPHADHHGQRLRGGRGSCSASPRSTRTSRRKADGQDRLHARTSSASRRT